jgi:hypothetical protein
MTLETATLSARKYRILTIFGRCGSLFFHSLFDGHSSLSSIPGISPFLVLSKILERLEIFRCPLEMQAKFIADVFCSAFNDPVYQRDSGLDRLGTHPMGPIHLDDQLFKSRLLLALSARSEQSPLSRVLDALHDAYELGIENSVIKSGAFLQLHALEPDSFRTVERTINGLKNPKILLLVRDPIENVESMFNVSMREGVLTVGRIAKFYRIVMGMLLIQQGTAWTTRDTLAIRFEDVKSNPKSLLDAVCAFLEIDFENSLLTSSYSGLVYRSPPTKRNPGISGFSRPRDAPLGYCLTEHDRAFFGKIFAPILDYFGYRKPVLPDTSIKRVDRIISGEFLDLEKFFVGSSGLEPRALSESADFINLRRFIREKYTSLNMPRPSFCCRIAGD